ncbi:hypothetical protein T02_13603 [Trichinella nativa]|uniref:Uncharacterized protein n=1 Tax=Trichinella nativa TaxID=6335 RepID=A0A0V1KVD2_9BILA|nr:hypothetical protein T06_13733 [Trichinella sp. T6]KRZ51293.1 hypothetical protein T02_13603 [Trichinella nativa]
MDIHRFANSSCNEVINAARTFQRYDTTEVINKNCLCHLVYLKETSKTVKSSSLSSSSIDEPSPTKIPCKTPEWITVTKTIIITIRPNEKV